MLAGFAFVAGVLSAPPLATTTTAATTTAAATASVSGGLVRDVIAEVAVAQLSKIDPSWHVEQRDCAGFVRFAYRTAFARLGRTTPLFLDDHARPASFADAETLVAKSFTSLGRDERARRSLRSGDVVAFRSERGDGEVVWHLMLVVVEAPGVGARVVYHPGERDASLRTGSLTSLTDDAPLEWRPVANNPAFLGFFRFHEFVGASS